MSTTLPRKYKKGPNKFGKKSGSSFLSIREKIAAHRRVELHSVSTLPTGEAGKDPLIAKQQQQQPSSSFEATSS